MHSAWVYKKIGKDGLFKLLEGKSRQAYAKTACSYTEDGINVKTFTGILKGNIISSNKETILDGSSFPYSYLFIPEGKERPLIEMSLDEICQIDHRSKAFKALFKTLSVIDDALLWIILVYLLLSTTSAPLSEPARSIKDIFPIVFLLLFNEN